MRVLKFLVLLAIFSLPGVAAAEITVQVTRGLGDAQPIAIVPLGLEGQGRPAVDVAAAVAADLERSGRFKPSPASDMRETPVRAADVKYQNWRVLGVDYVVVGNIQVQDGGYVIQFQLLDVYRGQQLMGYSVPIRGEYLRRGAH